MSLAITIFALIAACLIVALAMLWRILRIARRNKRRTNVAERSDVVKKRYDPLIAFQAKSSS